MKTKILLCALLVGFAYSVMAQEYQPKVGFSTESGAKTNFKKNKAGDNWFISIAGGVSSLYNDNSKDADFVDRLNFAPQLSFGKWFSPYIGFRTQLMGGSLHAFGPGANVMYHNQYVGGHVDLLYDITNHWFPYRESRVFRLIPWIGMGYINQFENKDQNLARSEAPTLNAGLLTAFRLSKRVDLNVELQGFIAPQYFDRVSVYHHEMNGVAQLSAGFTFKLGKTDFEVLEPMDYALLNDLNSQINNLRAENGELSKRPVSCPVCPDPAPTIINNNNTIDNVVYFRLNSSVIDKNQQINIYNTSEFMKEKNVPIKVIGYADKKTGKSDYNMKLSEKRARAVAKELTEKYGIPSNMISIEWKGSDVQPYSENNWNRVVIMRAEK